MSMAGVPPIFTAAEFARVLRCSSQHVRKLLKRSPAGGKKIPRRKCNEGDCITAKPADAWGIGSLPSPLIEQLAKLAAKWGCNSPLDLMLNPPPAIKSLARVSDHAIERAQKLQRALSACLAMPAGTSVSERTRIAAPHYKREFGKEVSHRYLRDLIDRILRTATDKRNFADLRLYLPVRPRKRMVRGAAIPSAFPELDQAFAEIIEDRSRPTIAEIANCWREVLTLLNDRIAAGASERKIKRQLRCYIASAAPFMGATPEAAKRALNRKHREAIDGGGIDQVTDGRLHPRKRARTKPSDFPDDINLLVQHAAFVCSGRVAQAYRQLHEGTSHNGARFSEEFRAVWPFDVRNAKSEVPAVIRQAASPAIRALRPLILGPRAARLALPSIHRDWSHVAAGSSYTSDDATVNHYVVDFCDGGEYEAPDGRRFNVVRPQFLPVVDERSGNPLGFSLIPAKGYSSWHIRTLITRICMRPEIGLPFEQFLFERGLWASRNVQALATWSEIDASFARHAVNLRLKHATTPKAKVIEQAIGEFQKLDEFAPGYIGRDEKAVKYERIHKFILQLKRAGQPKKVALDPTEMLMTMSQCEEMLAEVMQRFASEPQNGERLQGLSPAEGWAQLSGGRAHIVLPESLRYLLGTAESTQSVTNEGIVLRIGQFKHYYCGSEQLGALIGEKVGVRYNPELPEQITVAHIASDPRGLHPFAVPLFARLHAHRATSEDFATARQHQNRFASYGRALYRELSPKTNLTVSRSDMGSSELRAAGEAYNRLEREHIELSEARNATRSAIRRLADNLDIRPERAKRPNKVVQHLKSRANARARIIEMERALATEEQSK
jgi:hypothetical protein